MKQLVTNPYSFDSYTLEKDAHGQARVNAKIMKVGRLKYKTKDGKEFFGNISLEELTKAIPTASTKSITIKHPPGMLKPSDVKNYQEGVSADGYEIKEFDDGQWLYGPVVLQSDKAIETAESGKLGVSAGYLRNAVPTDIEGEFDFKDIDINHIAIGCDNPRAEGASISLDEAEDDSAKIYSFAKQQKPKKHEVCKMKEKLNAVKVGDFSLDEARIEYDEKDSKDVAIVIGRHDEIAARLGKVQESLDSAEVTHQEEKSELTGANKILTEQNESLKKDLENMISLDDVESRMVELADVREVAKVNGVEGVFKTEAEGMKAIVDKVSPGHNLDDAGIRGAYVVIKGDPKDAEERRKSREALKIAKKKESLDDKGGEKGYKSFSDVRIAKEQKEA